MLFCVLPDSNTIYYTEKDEICANKPHHLRRAEAMGGITGQTYLASIQHII